MSEKSDAAILFPDQTIDLAGETVTITAFSFAQGMRLIAVAQPLIMGLEELFRGNPEADLEEIQCLFAEHWEALMALLETSTGKPRAWIEGLNDGEGQLLLLRFWAVNQGFFINRLTLRAKLRMQRESLDAQELPRRQEQIPEDCLPPSLQTATAKTT